LVIADKEMTQYWLQTACRYCDDCVCTVRSECYIDFVLRRS